MKKILTFIPLLMIFLDWYYLNSALLVGSLFIFYPIIFFGIIFFFMSRENTLFEKILVFIAGVFLIILFYYFYAIFPFLGSIVLLGIIIYFVLIKRNQYVLDSFLFIFVLIVLGIIGFIM